MKKKIYKSVKFTFTPLYYFDVLNVSDGMVGDDLEWDWVSGGNINE